MMTKETLYKKSDYVRVLGDDDRFLIYHALFNNPLETNSTIIEMMERLSTPMTIGKLSELYEGDVEELVSNLVDLHFIVPVDQDERFVLSSLHEDFLKEVQAGEKLSLRLELAISNACNFGCQHCMHFLNNEVPSRIDCRLCT